MSQKRHPCDWRKVLSQCGEKAEPLLIEAKSNVWCPILRNKTIDLRTLCRLQKHLSCEVYYPWSDDYNTLRLNHNKKFVVFPNVIVMAESSADVAYAVLWAQKHHLTLSVRSGGHSSEGYSLSNGLVLDVSRIKDMHMDAKERTITVGGGVLIGPLYLEVQKYGLVLAAGSCANVGLAGLTLGGGMGYLMRRFGIVQDQLMELEMVTSEGKVVKASEKENDDLFWACRGSGGGQFGVVVRMKFRLHRLTNVVRFACQWTFEDAMKATLGWQDWIAHLSRKVTSGIFFNRTVSGIWINGLYAGDNMAEVESIVLSLVEKVGIEPVVKTILPETILDAARFNSGGNDAPPFSETKTHFAYHKLPPQAIQRLIEACRKIDPDDPATGIFMQSMGGAIHDLSNKDTAFFHRQALFWIEVSSAWIDDQTQSASRVRWTEETHEALTPYVSGYAYVNFPDRKQSNYLHAYYGEHLDRLMRIKSRWDPTNVFHNEQSIPVLSPPPTAGPTIVPTIVPPLLR